MNSTVTINKQNKEVIYLEINNPPVNALSLSLVEELNEAIRSISSDTRLVIFKGVGKGFCAGADLKERLEMSDEETIETVDKYRELFRKIEDLACPTIALLHGFVLGGGLELALSCDFRFAMKDCILGFPETSIGIIPGAGGTQRLTRLIGYSKSKKWIFTAKKFRAQEALLDNVIDQLFDTYDLMSDYTIDNFLPAILQNCNIAVSAAKKAINAFDSNTDSGYEAERIEYLKTLNSDIRKKSLKRYEK